ncbi:MAG TPA: hypothetical protein PLO89_02130 [Spirochaetota bacterium]|nr:hypothetical protein [Spirochaetota bacterium]
MKSQVWYGEWVLVGDMNNGKCAYPERTVSRLLSDSGAITLRNYWAKSGANEANTNETFEFRIQPTITIEYDE